MAGASVERGQTRIRFIVNRREHGLGVTYKRTVGYDKSERFGARFGAPLLSLSYTSKSRVVLHNKA